MKTDAYTKTLLTIIAVLMGILALRPWIQPPTVRAENNLAGVQFSSFGPTGFWAFDTRSGEVWWYDAGTATRVGKIASLGQPLVK